MVSAAVVAAFSEILSHQLRRDWGSSRRARAAPPWATTRSAAAAALCAATTSSSASSSPRVASSSSRSSSNASPTSRPALLASTSAFALPDLLLDREDLLVVEAKLAQEQFIEYSLTGCSSLSSSL